MAAIGPHAFFDRDRPHARPDSVESHRENGFVAQAGATGDPRMHGLYILFQALLEPGDEVILPDPTWPKPAITSAWRAGSGPGTAAGGCRIPVRSAGDRGRHQCPYTRHRY